MTWGIVLLALVLALDNFAVATSLGLQGWPRPQWARAALLFSIVAFFMLVTGVLLGRSLGDRLGSHATYFAGALLLLIGLRAVFEAVQEHEIEDLGPIAGFRSGHWASRSSSAWTSCAGLSLAAAINR